MERFLRYSREHDRAIRMIAIMPDGRMRQISAVVLSYDAETASLYVLRPPQNVTLPLGNILSADYARGDEGQD